MGTLILTMHTSADGFVATDDGRCGPPSAGRRRRRRTSTTSYREAAAVIYDVPGPVPTGLLTAWAIPPSCTVMRYAVADDFPAQR